MVVSRALFSCAIERPKLVLALTVILTLCVAPGLAFLRLRTDGHALVPAEEAAVQYDDAVRAEFRVYDPVVVLLQTDHPDGIFNTTTLGSVVALTDAVAALPDVTTVSSLATEHGHRYRPGTLEMQTFLERFPETPQQLQQLRDDLRLLQLYHGTIVSEDEQSTALLARVRPGTDRIGLYAQLQRLLQAHANSQDRIAVLGAPVAEALLGVHLLEDLGLPRALLGASVAREIPAGSSLWAQLRTRLGSQLGMVPIAIVIMVVVFLLRFRSGAAAVLPLFEVAGCLLFVFGAMGWCGTPVYLTIAILPVVLTAIGVSDEIHVYSHYEQQVWLDEDAPKSIATRRALEEVYRPILRTSLTTAIGFGSFALSPIAPVQAFGIWTAVGVIYCLIFSLTAVPALLVLLQPRPRVQPRKQRGGLVQLSAAAILKARWLILGGLAAAIVAAPFGVRQVVVQDSWIAGFAPDSAFATATRAYNDNFFGAHLLLVTVEETPLTTGGQLPASKIADREFRLPGDVIEGATELPIAEAAAALVGCWVQISRDPPSETESYNEWSSWIEAVRVQRGADGTSTVVVSTPQRQGSPRFLLRLRDDETVAWKIWSEGIATPSQEAHIARLQAMIESRTDCRVGGVLGPRDYIETTWFIKHRLDADQRKVPERPFDLRGIWPLYERIRGKERVRELVSRDRLRVLVTVFLKDANYVDTGRLLDALAAYEREELAGTRLQLGYAGDVAVSQSLIDAIVRTQSRSLLLSLLGICLVSMLFLRSFWWGLLCTLPSAMGVLAIFAAMGWGQVPLGVATSMFAGVLLGVGVDFAIHLLSAYRASLAAGLDVRSAWLASFTRVVPAITTNALSVGLGFGVLVVSRVPANAVLGGLIVVGVFACWCGTVLGLPALAAVFGGGRRRDAGEAKRPAHA